MGWSKLVFLKSWHWTGNLNEKKELAMCAAICGDSIGDSGHNKWPRLSPGNRLAMFSKWKTLRANKIRKTVKDDVSKPNVYVCIYSYIQSICRRK